jgi:hypothetical protein
MGDRCDLWLTYRKEDQSKIEHILGTEFWTTVESEGPAWKSVYIDQANYALFEERDAIADRGACFFGEHNRGDDYPASVFAAVDGEHADVPTVLEEPVVFLTKRGHVSKSSLRAARNYLRVLARAKKLMGFVEVKNEQPGTPASPVQPAVSA